MILKQVALNHPEYVRCSLTKTQGWLEWLRLFALGAVGRYWCLWMRSTSWGSPGKYGDQGYELLWILKGLEDT